MKIISLNTWGGKIYQPLMDFIKENSLEIDIFCLLEIYNTSSDVKEYNGIRTNLLSEINNLLPNFQVFYFPVMFGYTDQAVPVNFNLEYGQAIYIKKSITVNDYKDYVIGDDLSQEPLKKDFSNLTTPLQYLNFTSDNKKYAIASFHGTPDPADKLDTPRHLLESQKVKEIMDNLSYPKILVGDFNLLPETQSIKILETDMQNLIKEFKIQRTRSKLSPFYGKSDFQKFADYTFVSKDINVENFEVPRVEISDHLPMILEFS